MMTGTCDRCGGWKVITRKEGAVYLFACQWCRIASTFGYRWWLLRCHLIHWPRQIPRWLAYRLPKTVLLHAFILVYAIDGDCGPEFNRICQAWEAKHRLKIR